MLELVERQHECIARLQHLRAGHALRVGRSRCPCAPAGSRGCAAGRRDVPQSHPNRSSRPPRATNGHPRSTAGRAPYRRRGYPRDTTGWPKASASACTSAINRVALPRRSNGSRVHGARKSRHCVRSKPARLNRSTGPSSSYSPGRMARLARRSDRRTPSDGSSRWA